MRAYCIVAVLLFLVHFGQVLNWMVPRWPYGTTLNRLIFRIVGSCLVFIVAIAISVVQGRSEGERSNTETTPNFP